MKFNQSKNKFRKINNGQINNSQNLNEKTDEVIYFDKNPSNIHTPQIVYDSDWIDIEPYGNGILNYQFPTTVNKGELLPDTYQTLFDRNLNISEEMLQFLEINLIIENPAEGKLESFKKSISSQYVDRAYANVQGDSNLIYNGPIPFATDSTILTSELGSQAPEANTRKIWQVTILWTDPDTGDEYSTTGELQGIQIIENIETCQQQINDDPVEFQEVSIQDTFNARWYLDNEHEISAFDEDGFTGVGDYIDQEFISGTPDCEKNSTTTNNIEMSFSFNSVDDYNLFIFGFSFNITQGEFVGPGGGFFEGIHTVKGPGITEYELLQSKGHRVYYSSDRIHEFGINSVASLLNLSGGVSTIPYSSITSESYINEAITDTEETEEIITDGQETYYVVKIQENLYKILYKNFFTVFNPAINETGLTTLYDYTYSKDGTSYELISSSETDTFNGQFQTEHPDVRYKIQLVINPPFNWKERKNVL